MSTINIVIAFAFFLFCFSSSTTAAANNSELATQVCNRTTDSKFCMATFISDPSFQPSFTADPVSLAYIIFSKTYLFGSDTKTNIQSNISRNGIRKSANLRSCEGHYTNAVSEVSQVLQNLESETYCYFDTHSTNAWSNATACGKGLRRKQMSLVRDNENFVKLAGICYAVATLFPYNC